jgi:hypothetical protein
LSLKNTDVRTPGAQAIAKKWNLPLTKVYALISQGAKVEFEHNRDKEKAKQVARDHINERPDYYKRLKHMERLPIRMRESSVNEGLSTEPERDSETIGDYTGSSRKVMKVDEVNLDKVKKVVDKVPTKVKKAAKVGMTLANLATLGQVAGDAAEGRKGVDPKRGMVAATSALPGPVGYGAMAANYTIKGFDAAREHLKAKKYMKEQGSPANPARYTERPMYENDAMKNAEDKIKAAFTKDKVKDMFNRVDKERDKDPKWVAYKKRKQMKEEQIDEISAELVGKVSNARFWRGESPSKTLTRAINKKFIESGKPVPKKKDTKTVKEETTMDTKELINEALDDILENNLVSMKENFLTALQEKAMERLEEKKKEIAANYFAQ